jgi:hypothetical protein
MTTYAGEEILLAHTATFDGLALDDTNCTCAIYILSSDYLTVILDETSMVWSSSHSRWEYYWRANVPAGKYVARVLVGTPSGQNWEYFKITLKEDPSNFSGD